METPVITLEILKGKTVESVGWTYGEYKVTSNTRNGTSYTYGLNGMLIKYTDGWKSISYGGGASGSDSNTFYILNPENEIVAFFDELW